MTVEADLLGRPPRRRQVLGCPHADGPEFLRVASARDGLMQVRVPVRSSCSAVGEGNQWVTLPALPWDGAQ